MLAALSQQTAAKHGTRTKWRPGGGQDEGECEGDCEGDSWARQPWPSRHGRGCNAMPSAHSWTCLFQHARRCRAGWPQQTVRSRRPARDGDLHAAHGLEAVAAEQQKAPGRRGGPARALAAAIGPPPPPPVPISRGQPRRPCLSPAGSGCHSETCCSAAGEGVVLQLTATI